MTQHKEIIKVNPRETARRIVEALAGGLQKAADIYREYIEAGGDPMELRAASHMGAHHWQLLDDIATGRQDAKLFTLPNDCRRAVMQLPKCTQTAVIENGVDILANDGSSIRVPIRELTRQQTRQVFGPSGVRTPSEQAAWLKTKTIQSPPEHIQPTYEIKKGRLVVYRAAELSMSDLHRILAQMG